MKISCRKGQLLSFVLTFTLLALSAPTALAQESEAEDEGRHMLWRVFSEEGIEGYLVGSIHVMKPSAYPLDEVYGEVFVASDVLAFEADLDSMKVQMQPLVRRLGLYPEGKNLKSELSPDTYQQLKARAEKLGLPLARLQRLEPWMVAMMIPGLQMRKAGYVGTGIDAYFFKKAKEAGKKRVAFETPAEQLGFFDGLPAEKQEAYLRRSLEKAEENLESIDEIVGYWKSGNVEGLGRLISGEMQKKFPALYERLIVERNRNWMPQVVELLEGEARPMIVVGAAHMVGEEGLVAMLEARGYTVEQL